MQRIREYNFQVVTVKPASVILLCDLELPHLSWDMIRNYVVALNINVLDYD